MSKLKEGQQAPNFEGCDQDEKRIKLSDFRGQKLALYFYPRDNTPTCTKEACNFRDNYQILLNAGISVVGVSADTAKKHQNFIKKFDLPFPLIADVERKIIDAYDVWGLKKFMGRENMGIIRKTFLIDEEGKILKKIDKVDSANAAQQILELIE